MATTSVPTQYWTANKDSLKGRRINGRRLKATSFLSLFSFPFLSFVEPQYAKRERVGGRREVNEARAQ